MKIAKKRLEQLRSRLLALANELECGSIGHHRAVRVRALNQLRDQAIEDLRSKASEEVPQTLPGPETNQWIQWACSLRDPEDAEDIQTLRNGFARLDDFTARLEPNMWKPAESPGLEVSAEEDGSADQREQSAPDENRLKNLLCRQGFWPLGGCANSSTWGIAWLPKRSYSAARQPKY